jgi:hypothetical protein
MQFLASNQALGTVFWGSKGYYEPRDQAASEDSHVMNDRINNNEWMSS